MFEAIQRPVLELAENLQGALLYLDAGAGEIAQTTLGLPFLFGLGVSNVCSLELASADDAALPTLAAGQPPSRLAVFTTQLLTDAHPSILRAVLVHPTVTSVVVYCSVSEHAHACQAATDLGVEAYREYSDLMHREFLPLLAVCVDSAAFVFPAASSAARCAVEQPWDLLLAGCAAQQVSAAVAAAGAASSSSPARTGSGPQQGRWRAGPQALWRPVDLRVALPDAAIPVPGELDWGPPQPPTASARDGLPPGLQPQDTRHLPYAQLSYRPYGAELLDPTDRTALSRVEVAPELKALAESLLASPGTERVCVRRGVLLDALEVAKAGHGLLHAGHVLEYAAAARGRLRDFRKITHIDVFAENHGAVNPLLCQVVRKMLQRAEITDWQLQPNSGGGSGLVRALVDEHVGPDKPRVLVGGTSLVLPQDVALQLSGGLLQ
eukprot:XP_001697317.1 predicted protein [Chlamydomonas reinhardtii]